MPGKKPRLTTDPARLNPVTDAHVWRSPDDGHEHVTVVTHLGVYAKVHEHSAAALPNETGGFLLGRVARDQRSHCWVVEINEATPVDTVSQTPVHFSFDWRQVDQVRTRREAEGTALIGWYHTHPDMAIFLSDTDLDKTHRVLFSEPFQVALVYDPVRGRAGYFCWEAPQVIDPSQAAWREFDLQEEPDEPPAPAPVPSCAAQAPTAVDPARETPADILKGAFQQAAVSGVSAIHVQSSAIGPPASPGGTAGPVADATTAVFSTVPGPGASAGTSTTNATGQTRSRLTVSVARAEAAPAVERGRRVPGRWFLLGALSALAVLGVVLGTWFALSR